MSESEQQRIFKKWLREYKALLFKVVNAYAFSETDRDDLFQEIAIQVWRSVPNFRKESATSSWIYRVSLNTAIKWTRREQVHYNGKQPLEIIDHLLHKTGKQPDERLEWLYAEIGKMEKTDRSLCLLMLDGYNYKEMTEILGITESNVGVKIHRIKKHLITQSKEFKYYGI